MKGSIEGGNPVPENGTGGEVVSSGRIPRRAEPEPSDLDSPTPPSSADCFYCGPHVCAGQTVNVGGYNICLDHLLLLEASNA